MIGDRIKTIRLKLGKDQRQFGELFSPTVSGSAVSRWETGNTKPSSKRLNRIAELGGVSVDFLCNGSKASPEQTKKVVIKKIHGNDLNKDEAMSFNEAVIEKNPVIEETIKSEIYGIVGVIQDGLNEILKNPDINVLASIGDFVNLAALINRNDDHYQALLLHEDINFALQIATGKMKYKRSDLLPGFDYLLSSFPIKKDNEN